VDAAQLGLQSVHRDIHAIHHIMDVLAAGNDFISLMAGTLTVHHCPMRPIKAKR
jgi:hypothetical protein